MKVTSGGNPIELIGKEVKVGDHAKDFVLTKKDMTTSSLQDYEGKIKVLSVVPSLDTGVCDAQTRRFNTELNDNEDVVLITVSMDLPFAQARWCGNAGLENTITLSAHRDEVFANDYGVLMPGVRLLARSVFVLNEKNEVTFVQYVPEVSNEPNYEEVLEHLKEIN